MTIETVLTDEQIGKAYESMPSLYHYSMFARAIEQAVLQSPEVQAWKKDAERLNWIEGQFGADITCGTHNEWWVDWTGGYVEAISMRGAIDAAMEKQL